MEDIEKFKELLLELTIAIKYEEKKKHIVEEITNLFISKCNKEKIKQFKFGDLVTVEGIKTKGKLRKGVITKAEKTQSYVKFEDGYNRYFENNRITLFKED